MRVIAAAFADEDSAKEGLRRLVSELGLGSRDGAIAPHEDGFVIGMRLRKELDDVACRIVTDAGGRVLVDVPEAWTHGDGYPARPDEPPGDTARPGVPVDEHSPLTTRTPA